MAKVEDRTVGFSLGGSATVYGHISAASGAQIGANNRISSWGTANPAYKQQAYYDPNFNEGTQYSNAAIRSGVVNLSGYGVLPTAQEAGAQHQYNHPWAPTGHGAGSPRGGRPINPMLRFRRSQTLNRSTGWVGLLTLSSGSNKAFELGGGGRGQSSEDTTKEMYSTIETRMGTRAQFTDEVWNEAKSMFGRTWAGYKDIGPTGGTPFLNAQLGQMFKQENKNIGFARRRGL